MYMRSHEQQIQNFQIHYELSENDASAVIELFEKYLKYGYSNDVVLRAEQIGLSISKEVVRNIKNGYYANPRVFKILVELAKENENDQVAAQKALDTSA